MYIEACTNNSVLITSEATRRFGSPHLLLVFAADHIYYLVADYNMPKLQNVHFSQVWESQLKWYS